jgi:hypothetical protein
MRVSKKRIFEVRVLGCGEMKHVSGGVSKLLEPQLTMGHRRA